MQHNTRSHVRRACAVMLFAVVLSGCSTWTVQSEPPREVLLTHPSGNVQVRKKDGSRHNLLGAYVENDAIVGFRKVAEPKEGAVLHQRQYETRFDTVTIPLSEVENLAVSRSAPTRTLAFLTVAAAGVAFVLGSAGAN